MKRFLAGLVTFCILLALLLNIEFSDVLRAVSSASTPSLVLAFAFITINLVVVTWRLHRVLEHFGAHNPFLTSLRANIGGLVASLAIVNVLGAVIGRHAVLKSSGVAASLVAAISGYERIVLALVGASLFALGALYLSFTVGWTSGVEGSRLIVTLLAAAFAALVVAPFLRSPLEKRILRETFSLASLRCFSEVALLTLVGQLLMISTYMALIIGLGHHVDIGQLFAAAAIVSFAASLPISINGWGVREMASISTFGALGVPLPDALAASVLVGIGSTIGVLMLAPVLIYDRREEQSIVRSKSEYVLLSDRIDFLKKASSVVLSLSAAVLIFFNVPIVFTDYKLTLTLSDPVAILGLSVFFATALQERSLPSKFPRPFIAWIAGLTLLLAAAILSVALTGVLTSWVTSNRGLGWLVILGYVACGALITGQLGKHGQRRLVETISLTAVSIILVHGLLRLADAIAVAQLPLPLNFEGFSADRNAFAFQLVATLAVFQAFLPPAKYFEKLHIGMLAIIIVGLILTKSTTGLLAGAIVITLGFFTTERRRIGVASAVAAAFFAVHITAHSAGSNTPVAISTGFSSQSSIDEHVFTVVEGLRMWSEYPVFGAGLGSFIQNKHGMNGEPLVIHSTIVWVLAEMGLVGFLIVGWLPICWLITFARTHWSANGFIARASRQEIALLGLLLTFGVFSLAHDVAYQRLMWLLVGGLVSSVVADRFKSHLGEVGQAGLPNGRHPRLW